MRTINCSRSNKWNYSSYQNRSSRSRANTINCSVFTCVSFSRVTCSFSFSSSVSYHGEITSACSPRVHCRRRRTGNITCPVSMLKQHESTYEIAICVCVCVCLCAMYKIELHFVTIFSLSLCSFLTNSLFSSSSSSPSIRSFPQPRTNTHGHIFRFDSLLITQFFSSC